MIAAAFLPATGTKIFSIAYVPNRRHLSLPVLRRCRTCALLLSQGSTSCNACLLDAAHRHLGGHAGRAGGGVGQLVPGKRERPPLLGAVPVREDAALDPEDQDLARLVHHVRAEVGDAPLGDGPALVRGRGRAAVGGDLRQVATEEDQRVVAVAPEHQRAARIGAERVGLRAALLGHGRYERPRPDEVPGRLRLRARRGGRGEQGRHGGDWHDEAEHGVPPEMGAGNAPGWAHRGIEAYHLRTGTRVELVMSRFGSQVADLLAQKFQTETLPLFLSRSSPCGIFFACPLSSSRTLTRQSSAMTKVRLNYDGWLALPTA